MILRCNGTSQSDQGGKKSGSGHAQTLIIQQHWEHSHLPLTQKDFHAVIIYSFKWRTWPWFLITLGVLQIILPLPFTVYLCMHTNNTIKHKHETLFSLVFPKLLWPKISSSEESSIPQYPVNHLLGSEDMTLRFSIHYISYFVKKVIKHIFGWPFKKFQASK